jgi:hypothetical protein
MLPKDFRPKKNYQLVRLGKNNDGGYLVGLNSILESESLISFGIKDDWSFEEDFKRKKNIPLFAFDPSVSSSFWRIKIWMSIGFLFLGNYKKFFLTINNFFNFKKFFNKNNNLFFLEKVGRGGYKGYKSVSIYEILNKNEIINLFSENKNKNIYPYFFKVDIESAEYRILDELINIKDKISGIVIEFHDVDLHLDRIKNFIKAIDLTLVHIHANNMEETNKFNIPTLLELTFEKNPIELPGSVKLPHYLDQKNDPDLDLTELKFE